MITSFITILFILAIIDYLYFQIPNFIVLPAIILGIYFTGNWLSALIMFLLGAYLFKQKKLAGGDVKLMAMVGAFLGVWSFPAFALSRCAIHLYRIIKNHNGILPYAPFLGIMSIPFIVFIR